MIFGQKEDLVLYKGLHANLDKAVDYILDHDLSTLPPGKTLIDADELYVNVINGSLSDAVSSPYELHHSYLDLHIDITGQERVLFCNRVAANVTKPYTKENDCELLTGESNADVVIDCEHFVICMPGEPHLPCISPNQTKAPITKAVFKIRVC